MSRRRRVGVAGALLIAGACAPEPPTTEARIRAFMDAVHDSTGFSGAVVVARWGVVVFEGGWGMANREEGVPFTPDTPADGASLAKTFVAAGLRLLQAEAHLDLDDPVQRSVPEFPHPATTLRHLLEHSAGLAELDDPTGMTNEEVVAALDPVPLFEPGSRFAYCNECFDVLALVTERVTASPWEAFLRERFFDPLGMDSAFLRPGRFADWPGVRTRGYRRVDGAVTDHDVADDEPFYGSSNLYLSARDMARWGTAMIDGSVGAAVAGDEVGSRPRFASGEESALDGGNWFRAGAGPAYFDGHLAGFHGVIYHDGTTGLVVAWTSNVLGGRPQELQLTRALVRLAETGAVEPVPRFEARGLADGEDPAAIEGVYRLPGIGAVGVEWAGGFARVRIDGGPAHDAYPATGFYLPDLGVEMGFTDVQDGRYRRLHWLTLFDSVAGPRIDP